ncbi:aminoacetone oxidase family FAD-binding enzyme [Dehalogenimonas etheniformans]|uniref:Aminoacetone oxidase family FAD-binding enzyme n=1 Tax=Dehalogenimonas etheniformans TaxID=1536648 RepID=A0A2P5P7H2_9CHLR|nr:aminoacetone oxidase family FAD-binding enzyme [Dehalogenimonas etheniformans]PPD58234.1 aminoacetone oxidase family FAD-binding enzyme [Dehalogenimonas etheniformans]QNT75643.1 aminoacetone oxidase family FAD-binding enzyme [Dehalogenimonas etheniformans]
MESFDTAIIGGGAAGIVAAISAASHGKSAIILEKTPLLGKKILATGNGRCNLLNENLDASRYNSPSRPLVDSIFQQFGKVEILGFFERLGLSLYSQEGRIFPRTNQAASVLRVLELELKRLSVPIKFNFDCHAIVTLPDGFNVVSKSGETLKTRKLVVTGGGRTYPSFGSDGSIYELARQLGHSIEEPVPVVVPLVIKDPLCHQLQGQKIFASARSVINGEIGNEIQGELLFTKYGLSGTCILDVSEAISIAVARQGKTQVFVAIDMVPFMSENSLKEQLERRWNRAPDAADVLVGILPNKFGPAFHSLFDQGVEAAVKSLKHRLFRVTATRGWNEAEFTAGGVLVNEVIEGTLESKLQKGLYFAGEVLDVNGQRGGYNLGWAWASGWVAGAAE